MPTLNTILASLSPLGGIASSQRSTVVGSAPVEQASRLPEDTFVRGQEWRNRATSLDLHSLKNGGNTIISQVSRAYAGQDYMVARQEAEGSPADNNIVDGYVKEGGQNEERGEPRPVEYNEEAHVKEPRAGERALQQGPDGLPLNELDKQLLEQLKEIDQKVKDHEMAHLAAAGGYATGGAVYKYQNGPDGNKYAVSGEVSIDMSKEPDPADTLAKMKVVRRAALAPADPSPQDQRVASVATLNISEAMRELELPEKATKEDLEDVVAKKVENSGETSRGLDTGESENKMYIDYSSASSLYSEKAKGATGQYAMRETAYSGDSKSGVNIVI